MQKLLNSPFTRVVLIALVLTLPWLITAETRPNFISTFMTFLAISLKFAVFELFVNKLKNSKNWRFIRPAGWWFYGVVLLLDIYSVYAGFFGPANGDGFSILIPFFSAVYLFFGYLALLALALLKYKR